MVATASFPRRDGRLARRLCLVLSLALAAAIVLGAAPAWAITCPWNVAGGSTGHWHASASWTNCENGANDWPQAGDTAFFNTSDGKVDVNANVSVGSIITTTDYGGEIISTTAKTLTLSGNLYLGGGRLGATAAAGSILGSLTVNGNTVLWGDGVLYAPPVLVIGDASSDVFSLGGNATLIGSTASRTFNAAT